MAGLSEFQNEWWTEITDERFLNYAQVVGGSGVYLVIEDADTGEILRDDRPWQWQATGFPLPPYTDPMYPSWYTKEDIA